MPAFRRHWRNITKVRNNDRKYPFARPKICLSVNDKSPEIPARQRKKRRVYIIQLQKSPIFRKIFSEKGGFLHVPCINMIAGFLSAIQEAENDHQRDARRA